MTIGNKYKWVMLALLSCAFFFHQADRVLFGLLTIPIQARQIRTTSGRSSGRKLAAERLRMFRRPMPK